MINLMPPKLREDIQFARRNVMLVQYCILAAVVSVALIITMFFGLTLISGDEQTIKDAITQREATLSELQASETQAQNLSQQINTISALLAKELDYSEIIVQIGALIPAGARIDSLRLSETIKTAPLALTVRTDTQAKSVVVQQNFENSPLFAGADIQSVTPGNTDENGNITDYIVSLIVSYTGEIAEVQ